jgi:pimeloyl-ACP methyl ester carboxylesterase
MNSGRIALSDKPTMIAVVNGVSLAYDICGSGPAVVFIGGGGSLDRRMWSEQVAALAHRHTVVAYDIRGIGGSSSADRPFSHGDDLHALLAHLHVGPAFIVGLSFGAGIAVDLALDYPDDVKGLILVAPGLSDEKDENLKSALAAAEFARTNGMEALAQAIVSSSAVLASASVAVRERVKSLYIDNAEVFESGFAMVRHWQPTAPPAAERLTSIRQPAVIVVGDHDSEDVRITARKLAGSVKDAECVVLENAGHFVNLDAPEAFTTVVADFVASRHIPSG